MLRVASRGAFLLLCGVAAALPALTDQAPRTAAPPATADWPESWDGERLRPLPLTERETGWNRGFPGVAARFGVGRRELILRRVTQATRRLHGAADCFRGLGYTVTPQPAVRDSQGRQWGCFEARRGARVRLRVCERITDARGGEWTDVSAWFWGALFDETGGPWLAVTVIEGSPKYTRSDPSGETLSGAPEAHP